MYTFFFFFASTSTAAIGKWSITNAMQRNRWTSSGKQMQQELTNTCGSYTPA